MERVEEENSAPVGTLDEDVVIAWVPAVHPTIQMKSKSRSEVLNLAKLSPNL